METGKPGRKSGLHGFVLPGRNTPEPIFVYLGIPVQEGVSHPDLPTGYRPDGLEKPVWFDPAVAGLYRSLDVD